MKIRIRNNLFLSEVPEVLYEELTERLQFPNPKWIENARMGRWNRGTPKILRFYHKSPKKGLWVPRGYMRQLLLACRKYGIPYQIDDQRREPNVIDLRFYGQLKPFQQKAVSMMARRDFGTLSAPTGSGKTVMGLYLIAHRRQPALIVVHTKELALQWVDRIQAFLNIPKENVGFIGSGKKKIGEHLTVALVQSLYKCADEVCQHIGHLVVDECHRTPSRTFTDAVTEFDCKYMLGLSATPWRRDKLSQLIFWHLGDVHYEVPKEQLVEDGHIVQTEVLWRETDFSPFYDPVNEYSKMLSELTADDGRNHQIAADVAREVENDSGVSLVLSDRKKHCETLQALLRYKHGIKAELLTGDLTTEQRKAVIQRLERGKVTVLIATGQLIGEGFDCKNLSTLFLATPIRFSGRVIQYLGRVMRPAPGKTKARVFDYVDVKVDALQAAARARLKVYRQ